MRMLKCHLANNREGHFVTADEAMSAPGQIWSCASCGCRMVLHAGSSGDPAWFEHNQRSVARQVLMNCAHLDPEAKAEARHRKLRSIINKLDAPVTTLSWYCVWYGGHYSEDKYCVSCGTGIYSIEKSSRQLNYCCDISPG
ncbi:MULTISPECIES: putative zinc ribbon protein [unclassified Citrobacter]|uniref:putative zinc ribbon protein n=1 Tax=unclassified Citrobacter TaxID=2644389 RepID=UPI002574F946|nr:MULTISPECIES: putative zinc ribbon protein [unclassified Citrobacter]MDM2995501.1 zinc-ribbon domain-containing protein [Citrobacter sp. CK195]MDM3132916.1 zinc-ribbon domain-containing protein [Citrobacter sp. CK205]